MGVLSYIPYYGVGLVQKKSFCLRDLFFYIAAHAWDGLTSVFPRLYYYFSCNNTLLLSSFIVISGG